MDDGVCAFPNGTRAIIGTLLAFNQQWLHVDLGEKVLAEPFVLEGEVFILNQDPLEPNQITANELKILLSAVLVLVAILQLHSSVRTGWHYLGNRLCRLEKM